MHHLRMISIECGACVNLTTYKMHKPSADHAYMDVPDKVPYSTITLFSMIHIILILGAVRIITLQYLISKIWQ